jgi:antitoxin component of MazEF toxin-antitoxin module
MSLITQLTKVSETEDGNVFMPLPETLLKKLNIKEGDSWHLEMQDDGTLLLTPVKRLSRLRAFFEKFMGIFHSRY